ncbi:hypothetical protein TNCV_4929611 [Trichonephila clavipes]|nr:hypothetical protein TNCV_4929611 [Trichonephila clavipes]
MSFYSVFYARRSSHMLPVKGKRSNEHSTLLQTVSNGNDIHLLTIIRASTNPLGENTPFNCDISLNTAFRREDLILGKCKLQFKYQSLSGRRFSRPIVLEYQIQSTQASGWGHELKADVVEARARNLAIEDSPFNQGHGLGWGACHEFEPSAAEGLSRRKGHSFESSSVLSLV